MSKRFGKYGKMFHTKVVRFRGFEDFIFLHNILKEGFLSFQSHTILNETIVFSFIFSKFIHVIFA